MFDYGFGSGLSKYVLIVCILSSFGSARTAPLIGCVQVFWEAVRHIQNVLVAKNAEFSSVAEARRGEDYSVDNDPSIGLSAHYARYAFRTANIVPFSYSTIKPWPLMARTFLLGQVAQVSMGVPRQSRQSSQWQNPATCGSRSTSGLTSPHRQRLGR